MFFSSACRRHPDHASETPRRVGTLLDHFPGVEVCGSPARSARSVRGVGVSNGCATCELDLLGWPTFQSYVQCCNRILAPLCSEVKGHLGTSNFPHKHQRIGQSHLFCTNIFHTKISACFLSSPQGSCVKAWVSWSSKSRVPPWLPRLERLRAEGAAFLKWRCLRQLAGLLSLAPPGGRWEELWGARDGDGVPCNVGRANPNVFRWVGQPVNQFTVYQFIAGFFWTHSSVWKWKLWKGVFGCDLGRCRVLAFWHSSRSAEVCLWPMHWPHYGLGLSE